MSTEARMYCRMRCESSWGPIRSVARARRRRTCAASGVDNVIIPTNRADVCATVGCGGGGRLAASQFFDLASARARAEQQAEGGSAANSTRIAHDNERVDHWVADAHRGGHEGNGGHAVTVATTSSINTIQPPRAANTFAPPPQDPRVAYLEFLHLRPHLGLPGVRGGHRNGA